MACLFQTHVGEQGGSGHGSGKRQVHCVERVQSGEGGGG